MRLDRSHARFPFRGCSTWRTGQSSINPIVAAQPNARWTVVIALPFAAAPAGLRVDPLLDVDWLQPRDDEATGERVDERLEVIAVPIVRPPGVALLAPVRESVEDRDHGVAGGRFRLVLPRATRSW